MMQYEDGTREVCILSCSGPGGRQCDWGEADICDCYGGLTGPSDVVEKIIETESDDLFDYSEDQVYNHNILNGSYNSNIIKTGIMYNRIVTWNTNTTTNKTTINVNITKVEP